MISIAPVRTLSSELSVRRGNDRRPVMDRKEKEKEKVTSVCEDQVRTE